MESGLVVCGLEIPSVGAAATCTRHFREFTQTSVESVYMCEHHRCRRMHYDEINGHAVGPACTNAFTFTAGRLPLCCRTKTVIKSCANITYYRYAQHSGTPAHIMYILYTLTYIFACLQLSSFNPHSHSCVCACGTSLLLPPLLHAAAAAAVATQHKKTRRVRLQVGDLARTLASKKARAQYSIHLYIQIACALRPYTHTHVLYTTRPYPIVKYSIRCVYNRRTRSVQRFHTRTNKKKTTTY